MAPDSFGSACSSLNTEDKGVAQGAAKSLQIRSAALLSKNHDFWSYSGRGLEGLFQHVPGQEETLRCLPSSRAPALWELGRRETTAVERAALA